MHILFVCTGNVFRSMSAEKLFNAAAPEGVRASSAGIGVFEQDIRPEVADELCVLGADCAGHRYRQVTAEMVEEADLVVAMGKNHQEYLRREFGVDAPLLFAVCGYGDRPVLDGDEALPVWGDDARSVAYARSVVRSIHKAMPDFLGVVLATTESR